MDFYQKYLKYKRKYQELQMSGGVLTDSALYTQNYGKPSGSDPYADLHDNKNKGITAADYYRIKRKEKQCKVLISSRIGSKKQITHKDYENLVNYSNLARIPRETLDFCIRSERIKVDPPINQAPRPVSPPKNVARPVAPPPVAPRPVSPLKNVAHPVAPRPVSPPKNVAHPVAPHPIAPPIVAPRPVAPPANAASSCNRFLFNHIGNKKILTKKEYEDLVIVSQKSGYSKQIIDYCIKKESITISTTVPSKLSHQAVRPPSPPKKLGVPVQQAVRPPSPPKNIPAQLMKPVQQAQPPVQLPPIQHKPITDDNLEFFFNFNKSKNHILQKYSNLTNLQSPIKRIGTVSANGFINKLTFSNSHDNRHLLIAMKTSQRQDADNNYYEFTVGRCINKIKTCFPNFVYTFDFMNVNPNFKPKIMNDYNNVADFKANVTVKKVNEGYESQAENIEAGCANNKNSSIWLQWIPNSMSLEQVLSSQAFLTNKNTEAFNILFQIYATLSGLKDIYTHYDLHPGNVAFVPVPEGKTILIVYHINGKQYDINTHFIPVILDYGRSHINCRKFGSTIDSKHFANVGCSITKCRYLSHPSMCKTNSGLYFERDEKGTYSSPLKQFFIIPANKNISHDLRYLYLFMRTTSQYQDPKAPVNIYGSFNKVDEKSWFSGQVPTYSYGVPETSDAFGLGFSNKIKNVHDAIDWLISLHSKIYLNNPIVNAPKFGRMNIYPEVNKGLFQWTFNQV